MKREKAKPGGLFWITNMQKRKVDWLLLGWSILDCAAIFGDNAQVTQKYPDYITQVRLNWRHYSRRMKVFDDQDKADAVACHMDWNEFSEYVRVTIIDSFFGDEIEDSSNDGTLIGWAKDALTFLGASSKVKSAALRDPIQLLRFSYGGLNSGRTLSNTWPKATIFRFILIGIAGDGVLATQLCAFCYRWAAPSQVYCDMHGQQKATHGTRSKKARNYYVGSKAQALHRWRDIDLIPAVYKSMHRRQVHSARIAHCLWSAVPQAEGVLFDGIIEVLKRTPLVRAFLGNINGVSNSHLEALLRAKLDPLELWPEAWPEKIQFAERWMAAESIAAPGKRGFSPKTSLRISRAEELALSGKCIKEIAASLGISRTTIVKWCSRGRAPKLKALLSEGSGLS